MIVREATKEYLEKIKMEILKKASIEQCEQIRTINKRRITEKLGSVNNDCLQKVEEVIKITLTFGEYTF